MHARAFVALLSVLVSVLLCAQPTAHADSKAESLWARSNLAAWLVTSPTYDTRGRDPEARAAMLKNLGLRRYVYRSERGQDAATYDAELNALKRHGIELLAWRIDYSADDPTTQLILEAAARHRVHPQFWITGAPSLGEGVSSAPRLPKDFEKLSPQERHQVSVQIWRQDLTRLPQELRVKEEANRLYKLAKKAAPYGIKIGLYNHNGWFGMLDNQLEVIKRMHELGVADVGIVYNFSHARDELHDDTVNFPALWKKIQPYVIAVNITGMGSEKRFLYPSQGDSELEMMRVIQQSGWKGPVGVIGEQGGDAEVTLRNYLIGIDWIAAQLEEHGSGSGRPFPHVDDPARRKTIIEPVIARAAENEVLDQPWGQLKWYVSRKLKNSDTMTVGQAVIRPGQENSPHYHPNCDEILHVISGRILQTIGDKSVEMRAGDTVSIPMGVKHNAKNIGTEDAVLAISFSSADRQVVGE